MRLLLILMIALLQAGGCFFEPRSPQEADDPTTEVCEVPSSPDAVPDELIEGIATIFWDRFSCLYAEDFVFIPDPVDVSDLAGDGITYPEPWDLDAEFRAITDIGACHSGTVRQLGVIDLALDDIEFLPDDDLASETFTTDYALSILSLSVETGVQGTFTYVGVWEITTVETDEGWKIARWVDFRTDSEFPTWGFFKGQVDGGVDFCEPL